MAEQTSADFDPGERAWIRDDGTISPFQSIPHTFWWCMCTLTTVGYGDDVPTSSAGKVVAGITILTGVFVMAFPVILISYNYSEMTQRNELSYASHLSTPSPSPTHTPTPFTESCTADV